MQQLKKAQASISAQLKEKDKSANVVEGGNVMDNIKMRPSTPVYTEGFKRDDDNNKDQKYYQEKDKKRRAVILL